MKSKHIMMSLIKTITSVLKVSTYIITAHPIELAAILHVAIMSVSTFKTDDILYTLCMSQTIFYLIRLM